MKTIALTHGLVARVDDDDFEDLNSRHWFANREYSGYYAVSQDPGGKQYRMHRVILGITDPGVNVDHRDGDTLNNQRYNLRPCTDSQNGANRKISSNNKSGYKGVHWNKAMGRWAAQIQWHNKVYTLGYHSDPLEAARAYDRRALQIFGEFARTNLPRELYLN
jgi:hypothetical protein